MYHERLLEEYTEKIEEALEPYLNGLIDTAADYHPFIRDVYDSISQFVLRKGMRLFSASTLLTYKGYAGQKDAGIMEIVKGVEMYRHAVLVHDDLVDRDDFRRGGETIHRQYEYVFDQRFGLSVAVFSGNILEHLAFECFLGSGFDDEKVLRVIRLFEKNGRAVNESQILDCAFEYKKPDIIEWATMAKNRAVTLFNSAILSGAILADAPEEDIALLDEASINIGYAFDIQDDIIDTFADEKEYGRSVAGDLRFWKKPLHMVYTLEMAPGKDVQELERLVGKRIGTEEIRRVREIIRDCGALEAAKRKSGEHAKKAVDLIQQTSMDTDIKAFYSGFVEYVSESLEWYK